MSKLAVTAFFFAAVFAFGAEAGQRLSGTWLTEDGSSRIRFEPCGAEDCGRIVWLQEPISPQTNEPLVDKNNPDRAKQSEPLLGLTIVSGLTESVPATWQGSLYNPRDGNTYSGQLTRLSPDKMQLKGCAFAGLFCKSETWTLIEP